MATLSPFIKTTSSASSPSSLVSTPGSVKTSGRLSLLSSDIEEDLGFIDIYNNPEYDHISRDEFWLLNDEEYDPKIHRYDVALEWINSFPQTKQNDSYFQFPANVQQTLTPINGYNRFEYLTKSVSRTATITKRKIDINCDENTPPPVTNLLNSRYGTITKGTFSRPISSTNQANRTYEVLESKLRFSESPSSSNSNDNSNNNQIIVNTPTFQNGIRHYPVNTNTITKSNRRVLNVTLDVNRPSLPKCDDFSENNSDFNANVTKTDQEEEFGTLSSDGLTDNNDLKKQLNRTYEIENEDSDETTESSSTTSTTHRNYPTISRNVNRTLLRREASQGNLINNTNRKLPQQKKVYLVSSNDDLLSSDCSTMSLRSNLSSTSGRSEPNLIDAQCSQLSVYQQPRLSNIQAKKFQSRLMGPTTNNANNGRTQSIQTSRIARPSSQNGAIANNNNKKINNQLVDNNHNNNAFTNTKANSYGNMNSIPSNQYNMPRTVSQIEMNDEDYDNLLNSNTSQRILMSGLDRKSTFRVHRPSTINVSAQTLFNGGGQQPQPQASNHHHQPIIVNHVQHNLHHRQHYSSSLSNSNENLNSSVSTIEQQQQQEETDAFRAKVLMNALNNFCISSTRSNTQQYIQNSLSSSQSTKISLINTNNYNKNNALINNNNHILNFHNNNIANNHIHDNNSSKVISTNQSRIPAIQKSNLIAPTSIPQNFINNYRSSIPVCGKVPQHRPNQINNIHESANLLVRKQKALPLMVGAGKIPTTIPAPSSVNNHQEQNGYFSLDNFRNNNNNNGSHGSLIDDEDNSWQNDCY